MYKIKAKPGYNIIVRDLKIKLDSSQNAWKFVAKEDFDNSPDCQSVKHLMEIEECNGENIKAEVSVPEAKPIMTTLDENHGIKEVATNSFVSHFDPISNPEGTFVAQPQETVIDATKTEEVKVEETKLEEAKVETTTPEVAPVETNVVETAPEVAPETAQEKQTKAAKAKAVKATETVEVEPK